MPFLRLRITKVHFDESPNKKHLVVGEDINSLSWKFFLSSQFQIKLLENTFCGATEVKSVIKV